MSPQKKGEAKPETIRSLFPAANNLGKKNWFSCTPRYTEMYFSGKGWERVARAPRTEELLLTPWPAASCVFVQPAHSTTAPQPPCSSAPTTNSWITTPLHLHPPCVTEKALTGSIVLNLVGLGRKGEFSQ